MKACSHEKRPAGPDGGTMRVVHWRSAGARRMASSNGLKKIEMVGLVNEPALGYALLGSHLASHLASSLRVLSPSSDTLSYAALVYALVAGADALRPSDAYSIRAGLDVRDVDDAGQCGTGALIVQSDVDHMESQSIPRSLRQEIRLTNVNPQRAKHSGSSHVVVPDQPAEPNSNVNPCSSLALCAVLILTNPFELFHMY